MPASLLTCADEPPRPDLSTATDRIGALAVVAITKAGAECRRDLASVAAILAAPACAGVNITEKD
ncbi:MAG: hypothetical protein AB7I36_08165 [Rhodospirillaceae bacterium]